MRARIPAELGCVVDIGLTSEAVAVAIDPQVGTTIVVVTRAFVGKCPLLSKVGPDEYVATLGGGTVVSDRKAAVLDDPQWARARDYLLHDPIAFAAELPGRTWSASRKRIRSMVGSRSMHSMRTRSRRA